MKNLCHILFTLSVVAVYPTGERLTSETFTVQPIRVEHSSDLQTWESSPFIFLPYSPRLFIRAALVTP